MPHRAFHAEVPGPKEGTAVAVQDHKVRNIKQLIRKVILVTSLRLSEKPVTHRDDRVLQNKTPM